jgi:hypothetical protein
MPFRFVDLDARPSGYKDFTARRREPTLVEVFVMSLMIVLTGVGMVLLINDKLALTGILFTMIGLACVYLTVNTHHNRELLQATEFHNALFASALARNYAFCLIAASDGTIIYCNAGFKALFPGIDNGHGTGEWLTAGNAPPEDQAWVLGSIEEGTAGQATLTMADGGERSLTLLLLIEPIERPAGFVLMRGREQKSPDR